MSKIKQLLNLRIAEPKLSLQDLGSIIGMDRGTISSYFKKITDNGYDISQLLLLDDLTLEAKFHQGNPAYLEEKFIEFKSLIPYFEKELNRKHMTRKLLWAEYKQTHPDGYGYSQFCFHLTQLKVARKDSSAILNHDPAKELYVDYAGDKMAYVDQNSGEVVMVEVFVAVLPYSNYTFALAVPTQTTEDFTACKQGHSVAYYNLQKLTIKLKTARLEGQLIKAMEKLAKTDLLILDDFALVPLDSNIQNDLMEIIEDRHAKKSTIIASQLPVSVWFDAFPEATVADALLDRIIHASHRFELKGDSLRRKK